MIPAALRLPLVAGVAGATTFYSLRERSTRVARDEEIAILKKSETATLQEKSSLLEEVAALKAALENAQRKAEEASASLKSAAQTAENAAEAKRKAEVRAAKQAKQDAAELVELRRTLEDKQKVIMDLRKAAAVAAAELKSIRVDAECSVDAQEAAEALVVTLRTELQGATEQLEAAQAQAAWLEVLTADKAAVEAELAASRSRAEELVAALQSGEEKAVAMAAKVAQAEVLAGQIEKLRAELEDANGQTEELKAAARSAEEKAMTAMATAAELRDGSANSTVPKTPVMAVASRLASLLSTRQAAAEDKLAALDAAYLQLRTRHEKATEELAQAHACGEVNGVVVTAVRELGMCEASISSAQSRLSGMDEAAIDLKAESNNPFDRFFAWREREDLESLKASVASYQARLPGLQAAADEALLAIKAEREQLAEEQADELAALEAESPRTEVEGARAVVALLTELASEVKAQTEILEELCMEG